MALRQRPTPQERKDRDLLEYDRLETIRTEMIAKKSRYHTQWALAAQYSAPQRYRPDAANDHDGSRKRQRILRNTAARALRIFQSGMMNGNTPRSRPWFRLASMYGKQSFKIQKQLQSIRETIDRYFHISNLYKVMPGMYKDVGIFSNGAFAMLPNDKYGFYFYPISVGQYCISSSEDGKVSTFMRDYSMSIRQVVERFGLKKKTGHIDWENSLNPYIKELYDQALYDERIVITQLILPNPRGKMNAVEPLDRRFHTYSYMNYESSSTGSGRVSQTWANWRNSAQRKVTKSGKVPTDLAVDDMDEFILQISGYDYFPIICARWEEVPDEAYGVAGPMELALEDVLTLQSEQEYRLEGIAKLVRPPFIGPANLARYRVSTSAGGITYYDEPVDGGLRPLFEMNPHLAELIKSQEETDQFVNQAFFVDLFMALAQHPTKSHVSVEEVQKRAAESLQLVSPVINLMSDDVNENLIANAYYLLERSGIVEPIDADRTGPVAPEYISVLAQATKVSMATGMDRYLNFLGAASETFKDPGILNVVNREKYVRKYGDVLGVEADVMSSESEYAAKQKQIEQGAMQEQQAQAQMEQATTAKDLSQAKFAGGEESLLDRLEQQAQGGEGGQQAR